MASAYLNQPERIFDWYRQTSPRALNGAAIEFSYHFRKKSLRLEGTPFSCLLRRIHIRTPSQRSAGLFAMNVMYGSREMRRAAIA
jgi:hypothetical protein